MITWPRVPHHTPQHKNLHFMTVSQLSGKLILTHFKCSLVPISVHRECALLGVRCASLRVRCALLGVRCAPLGRVHLSAVYVIMNCKVSRGHMHVPNKPVGKLWSVQRFSLIHLHIHYQN